MASKRFKRKLCVYCCDRLSVTGDHLFAREFFVDAARPNLPQVPACDQCNNEKSRLEHYLTTVLPFGGRHADAHEALEGLVPGRLAKNLRLARVLSAGQGHVWHMENQVIRRAMVVPIDAAQATALFAFIARGLAWLHFSTYLLPEHSSNAIFLSRAGEDYFARLFAMNAANRVHQDLGRGTISYVGAQAVDSPQLTIWRLEFYGGMALSGDPALPGQVATAIGAVTGPRRLAYMLSERPR